MRRSAAASVLIATSLPAAAQSPPGPDPVYPLRPIRIVVIFAAGSASDTLARQMGQKMADRWSPQRPWSSSPHPAEGSGRSVT